MAVLVDWQIQEEIKNGQIIVSPFDSSLVNPASLDIRLGGKFGRIKAINDSPNFFDIEQEFQFDDAIPIIDPLLTESFETIVVTSDSYCIKPKEFIVAQMLEHITLPDNISAQVLGKSSLARLGLGNSHQAGFLDPGFAGEITLEIYNYSDNYIVLTKGMKIGQLLFHKHSQAVNPYKGKYLNQTGCQGSKGIENVS